jgi:hypothetical protein
LRQALLRCLGATPAAAAGAALNVDAEA